MKVGFLVSSVSREAGGLFQSVRGLAKAVTSTNTTASVFGISDPNSTFDLLKWRPLSVCTYRPQFRPWGYSNELVPALHRAPGGYAGIMGAAKCDVEKTNRRAAL